MTLNDDNIELYLFRYKEELLGEEESAEVELALAKHPEWQAMADLYDPSLTLPAGATMDYADAESLRDGGPKAVQKPLTLSGSTTRRNVKPLWFSMAAAACLLLFVTTIVKFVNMSDKGSGQPLVAEVTVIDTVKQVQDTLIESDMRSNSPKATTYYASVLQREEETEYALVDEPVEQPAAESDDALMVSPMTETPSSGSEILLADNPTIQEKGSAEEEGKNYVEGIIVRNEENVETESSNQRYEQLRNLALRASGLAANVVAGHKQRREAFEESIENNELISNLIATIE